MPELNLEHHREDPEEVRGAKDVLKYGDHLEDCDRSNEKGDPNVQHDCCAYGWCLVSGYHRMALILYHPEKKDVASQDRREERKDDGVDPFNHSDQQSSKKI